MSKGIPPKISLEDWVYIVCILGKRLIDDCFTLEGLARTEEAERLLKLGVRNPKYIAITGGRRDGDNGSNIFSEATLISGALEERGIKREKIILDREARTTIQNIRNALGFLYQNELKNVILSLVSSNYHLERLGEIYALMPDIPVLLREIEQANKNGLNIKYEFCPSSDFYMLDYYPEERISSPRFQLDLWKTRLYLLSDKLRIMETNLEAIANHGVTKLYSSVMNGYEIFLNLICKEMIDRRPRIKELGDKVDEVIDKTSPIISELRNSQRELRALPENLDNSNVKIATRIYKNISLMHEKASRAYDNDEPANNFANKYKYF